jgi:hypothetical protein
MTIGPDGRSGPEFSTGNDEDDELLRQIAQHSPLGALATVHFLLCRDEVTAGAVAAQVTAAGWAVQVDFNAEGAERPGLTSRGALLRAEG